MGFSTDGGSGRQWLFIAGVRLFFPGNGVVFARVIVEWRVRFIGSVFLGCLRVFSGKLEHCFGEV
ncbi:hypothetical protein Tsubulata_017063 [Turnera subulata]|uniref:Uncharacterized protein n=1 Tax=Turnera subulata TaxID=218843 RepID=A0A9Q0F0N6_9ROSI|nr:hypothetical protein Tsubulata_017063 [Turnera subulata]